MSGSSRTRLSDWMDRGERGHAAGSAGVGIRGYGKSRNWALFYAVMWNTNFRSGGRAYGWVSVALLLVLAARVSAAGDVKVDFALRTTDAAGKAVTQNRSYYVYRPDKLPKDRSAPMVLVMSNGPATFFRRKADEAGFVLVSCVILGHTSPKEKGFDDIDYTTTVMDRVAEAENCKDAFVCGLSMGGHMACAYACERPTRIRAAADLDEFMGLTTNIPTAPVPMLFIHGTKDEAVPYAKVKDTVDAWRATNGLMGATPITTYENSPLAPGAVTQATWEGDKPVAFVTIIGGAHTWPMPTIQTGYDVTDGIWAFFAQFLTGAEHAPRIASTPLNNVQHMGHPASFRVAATGDGPLRYQWQKNGKDIPGATSSRYTAPLADKDDDGAIYRVVVTNRVGSVTSEGAALKVIAAPVGPDIAQHPKDQSVVAGQPVAFDVRADQAGLRYQWQKNGMDIIGATGASYTIRRAITADSGSTFRVLVNGAAGISASIPATLTVTPAPQGPVILTNPERARLHPGETATFSITVKSTTPMSYQWQQGRVTTDFMDIPGANSATYTPPAARLTDHRTLLRCVVTNAAGTAVSAGEMMLVTNADSIPNAGATQPMSGK
jgi:poly(3-hydroxybutyrate) depolymerase